MRGHTGRCRSTAPGCAAITLGLALLAATAQGQARAGASAPGEIEYEAPPECPDQAFFEAQLRARVAPELRDQLARLRVHASIELRADSARGQIRLGSAGGTATTRRRIEAASCREVVEGLALIAALSVAPSPDAGRPDPTPGTRAGTTGERGSTAREAAPDSAADPRAATADERASPDPARAAREDATSARAATQGSATRDEARTRAEAHGGERSQAGDERQAAERDPEAQAEPSRLSIAAGLIVFQGLAPELQPGLQLGLGLRVSTWAGLEWVVRLAGRLALEQRASSASGQALFGFLGGAVSGCASGPVVAPQLVLQGCAVIEPGALSAEGRETRNAEGYRRAWVAFGGGVGALVQPLPALGVQLGAELLAPFRRDRYLLAQELVHRVPAVSLRLGVSIVLSPQ